MRIPRLVLVSVVFLLLATPVLAHVPTFPDDNSTPERAVEVPNPVKSWSFYDSLGNGDVTYYRTTLQPGERLQVGTFTPLQGQFTPSLVVMSPEIGETGPVPERVTVPDGMGAIVVSGERPETATYEPFAPSANYHTANFVQDASTERTYLIAVYEPANRTGPVGVTVGYKEAFSPTEYVTVPFDLVRTHLWEGQPPFLVIGPFLLTVLAGAGFVRRRWQATWEDSWIRIALASAGVLLIGSGVNTAVQMGLALGQTGLTRGALVTAVFVVVPIVAGRWVVGRGVESECRLTPQRRLGLAIAGVLTLLTWAGFIVGAVILIGLAVIPSRVLPE